MDPLLIDIPERIDTERLALCMPRAGDGALLQPVQTAATPALRPWMPWAQEPPTTEVSESYCRRMHARFLLREDLVWLVRERAADGTPGAMLASVGLHRIDWEAGRFEIGYWRATDAGGRGIVNEAVRALARLCFDRLGAFRVEIRMDDANRASWRVAERAGFTLEALLRGDSLDPSGQRRSTRVYARVRGVEEALP